MNLAEAKEVLRIDTDFTENDILINSLLTSIPGYIEIQTGMSATDQATEPLVNTVTGFILQLWYFNEHSDDTKLKRVIDNLLICITLKARETNTTE